MLNKLYVAALGVLALIALLGGCAPAPAPEVESPTEAPETAAIEAAADSPIIILEPTSSSPNILVWHVDEVEQGVNEALSIFDDCELREDFIGAGEVLCQYLPVNESTWKDTEEVAMKAGTIMISIDCSGERGAVWWVYDKDDPINKNCRRLFPVDVPTDNTVPKELGSIPKDQLQGHDGEKLEDAAKFKLDTNP
jgi:hypothetical protein